VLSAVRLVVLPLILPLVLEDAFATVPSAVVLPLVFPSVLLRCCAECITTGCFSPDSALGSAPGFATVLSAVILPLVFPSVLAI
jgi:hypothetical protein